jgi:hypothetical protein
MYLYIYIDLFVHKIQRIVWSHQKCNQKRKSKKEIQYNGEKKEQTMIYKTLSRKHKIEQDEPQ